ncbi:MAG: hypothetical protein GX077_02805 [Tissierellia bacterium]|nr:hypothetical protein [Tissierellia bacterium]
MFVKFICYECGHIWDEDFEDNTNCSDYHSPNTAEISRTRYGYLRVEKSTLFSWKSPI